MSRYDDDYDWADRLMGCGHDPVFHGPYMMWCVKCAQKRQAVERILAWDALKDEDV